MRPGGARLTSKPGDLGDPQGEDFRARQTHHAESGSHVLISRKRSRGADVVGVMTLDVELIDVELLIQCLFLFVQRLKTVLMRFWNPCLVSFLLD